MVAAIMTIVFGAVFAFLRMSDTSWSRGQDKLAEQREARRIMGDIAGSLRYSSPNWGDGVTTDYPADPQGTRIDFYIASFYPDCCPSGCTEASDCIDSEGDTHEAGDIKKLTKVTYKLDPNDAARLLKKVGIGAEKVLGTNISSIDFSCGCSGCAAVSEDCPFVDISVTTQKRDDYVLESKVILRNKSIEVPLDIEVEEPEEGEF